MIQIRWTDQCTITTAEAEIETSHPIFYLDPLSGRNTFPARGAEHVAGGR